MKSSYVLRDSIRRSTPIIFGYLPVAIAFGILSKTMGLSLFETTLISLLVYSGAAQFMFLNLFVAGVGPAGIIITTFLINFRHFLMSASIASRLGETRKRWFPLLAFGVTDETFAVVISIPGKIDKVRLGIIEIIAYLSWQTGTLIGFVAGNIIPEDLTISMSVGLYGLFIALLMPQIKKSYRLGILAVTSGILNGLLLKINLLPQGWSIIISVLISALLGVYFIDRNEELDYE